MPVPWLPVLPGVVANLRPTPVLQSTTRQVFGHDDLIVTSESSIFDPVLDIYTFEKGVVARYGPTSIRCDKLIVNRGQKKAQAMGSVQVSDPEADLSVTDIEFSWDPASRSGKARNVRAQIGNVRISASSVDINPTQYVFTDVAGTSCSRGTPFYELRTRRLVITPGRVGRAEKPNLYLLGKKIITLPSRTFELDPRTEGFQLPTPSRRRDGRSGISWSSGFMLNDRTNLNMNYSSYQRTRPNYGIVATRSLSSKAGSDEVITPPSEFQERFGYGYFDNVRIFTPEMETQRIGTPRTSIAIGSTYNQTPTARDDNQAYSKPLEIMGDQSGRLGTGAYRASLRLQTIRVGDDPLHARAMGVGVYSLPTKQVARDIYSMVRFDTNVFAGNQPYAWGRSQLGVVYRPSPILTLGVAGILTGDIGNAQFPGLDTPYARNGYVWRADIDLGPTRLSFLQKYDSKFGLYDREYTMSQVVGCFEPFVLYRKFPQEYVFGVRLRLDPFYRALRQRNFKRTRKVDNNRDPKAPVEDEE